MRFQRQRNHARYGPFWCRQVAARSRPLGTRISLIQNTNERTAENKADHSFPLRLYNDVASRARLMQIELGMKLERPKSRSCTLGTIYRERQKGLRNLWSTFVLLERDQAIVSRLSSMN